MNIEQERRALLPCPFCGSTDIHVTPDEVGSGGQWVSPVHVVCGGDCVAGQSGGDKESAIAAWNRRAALQSQDRKPCTWEHDAEIDAYETTCGNTFIVGEGTPAENDMKFCCFCGGALIEAIDHARRVEGDEDATI